MLHLFHIGEVMLKVGGNSAAAFAWKPAQNYHLRWSRSIGFLMQNLYLEAAASSLGLLGRKLKQLFNSQHCFGSTSCWRLDRTASAFSDTLELFVSQSCEEFSGRACAACHVSDGRRRPPTWQSPLQAPQSPPPTLSEVLQTSLCTPPPDQQVIVMPRILSMGKMIKSSWRNKLQAKITWR